MFLGVLHVYNMTLCTTHVSAMHVNTPVFLHVFYMHIIPGGGGNFTKYLETVCSMQTKNWTQSDLRFCENEGSNRSKINKKGGQLD